MSFSGEAPPGATTPQHYYCHQCERTVTLSPSAVASGDISCPNCGGDFLEEIEPPVVNPSPNPSAFFLSPDPFLFSPSPLSSFLVSSRSPAASFDIRDPNDLFGLFGVRTGASSGTANASPAPVAPAPFDPMTFLQNHMQQLIAGGANIQIVVEGGGSGGGLFGGGSLGDFVLGPGLEQIIQQLAENDPNRYGTPPAAKFAVASLPDIKITPELIASDEAQCAVCKDIFEVGDEVKQMPCKHIYHKDCILPWLELHNSCPVCRFELPTDDLDYEQQRGGTANPTARVPTAAAGAGNLGGSGGSAAGASGDGNSPGRNTLERRFRVSIPWPFRGLGARGDNADGGASTDASSGNQGDGHSNA